MQRIVQSHRFGPYRADVVEVHDDEAVAAYQVLVEGSLVATLSPDEPPTLEDVVRIYDGWLRRR